MNKVVLVLLITGSLFAKSEQASECDKYQTLADSFMKVAEKKWEENDTTASISASSMSAMYNSMFIKDCSIELITLPDGTKCVKNSSPRCFEMPTMGKK